MFLIEIFNLFQKEKKTFQMSERDSTIVRASIIISTLLELRARTWKTPAIKQR